MIDPEILATAAHDASIPPPDAVLMPPGLRRKPLDRGVFEPRVSRPVAGGGTRRRSVRRRVNPAPGPPTADAVEIKKMEHRMQWEWTKIHRATPIEAVYLAAQGFDPRHPGADDHLAKLRADRTP
jgi:hypothetical protein